MPHEDKIQALLQELQELQKEDAYLLVRISKERGVSVNYEMSADWAMTVICYLIRDFKLDPRGLAYAYENWLRDHGGRPAADRKAN